MTRPSPRKRVLTLVHGTFSPDAAWTQEGSELFRRLEQQLDGETIRRRITWRGFLGGCLNNGHGYRLEGGARLAEALKASFREHPDAEHWVIAHSHGGNVAFYALRDPQVASRLDGIVTLATPFIRCQGRDHSASTIKLWLFLLLSIGFVTLPLLLGALALYVLGLEGDKALLFAVLGALAFMVPLFVLWLRKERIPAWFSRRQERTIERLALPTPTRQRVLSLSIRRDEAGGGLKAMYAIAAWPHWLWDGLIYVPLLLVVFLLALTLGDSFLSSMSGKTGFARLGGAFQAALGWGILIGFGHLLVMTFLPRLTRALGLGFGQESLVDNLVVDIRSELTPEDFPGLSHRQFSTLSGGFLAHSRLYQSEEVVPHIARFIAGGT